MDDSKPDFREDFGQRIAKKAGPKKTAVGGHTEALSSGDSILPANTETPLSESPRVKESGIDAAASPHPDTDRAAQSAIEGTDLERTAPAAAPEVKAESATRPASTSMKLTDEAMSSILKSTQDDIAAIKKFGSREAAAEAGKIASRQSSPLPWQKFRTADDVSAFMDNAARVMRSQMDTAKGGKVMSDAKVNAMVKDRAELFGEDPALVLGQIREAGHAAKDMTANMETGYLIGSRMMEETYDLAFRLENGMEADAARAGTELKHRLLVSADFMASARSMSSNSGRALRRMRGQFHFTPELMEKVKTMDGMELARLLAQTKGNPKLLAQTINPDFLTRWIGRASDSLTNSLLWLYPTHVVNMTSNMYMLAARPMEKWLGSFAIKGPQAEVVSPYETVWRLG